MRRGIFITFEGTDGSGKSTQIRRLTKYLEEKKIDYIVTREPGGTVIGEAIREILLAPENSSMAFRTELLLYAAARAQHVEEVIAPALRVGTFVICDRFTDSSVAYQGFGRGYLDQVVSINHFATAGLEPDFTFLLNLEPDEAKKRLEIRGEQADRLEMEDIAFKNAVWEGYEELAKENPHRIYKVNANLTADEVWGEIKERLDNHCLL